MVSIIEKLSEFGIKVDESPEKGRYCVAAKPFKKGDLIVMSAFGAGFISGAVVLEWEFLYI